MSTLEIVTVPNPKLLGPTQRVGPFDLNSNGLLDQIEKMTQALRAEGGVGLAANQLGYNNKVIVVEFNDPDGKDNVPYQIFINPEIVELSEERECLDEGCLSVPPIELPVERAKKVKLKAQNEHGRKIKITAKGLLARILQHETDHLNNILFTDRVREKYLKDFPEIKKQKILFIGSDKFAEPILKGMILLGLNIPLVISESPKLAGRDRIIRQTAVSQLALEFNKKLIETDNIKKNIEAIKTIKPDLIILTDFGQLIPPEILAIPRLGSLNLHPSLLPKYRGATPIQTAILKGDEETGVSLMRMTPKFDKGPILAQIKTEIYHDDTAEILRKRLSVEALKLLYEVLPKILAQKIREIPQDENQASYAHKFKKEDGAIDWTKTPEEIDRQIRAFQPWPGTYSIIDNKRLIILAAHLKDDKIVLDLVQPEGKKPMIFKDFLRGYHGPKPEWLTKIS